MVDFKNPLYDDTPQAETDTSTGREWADYPKAAASAVQGLRAGAAAGARRVSEAVGSEFAAKQFELDERELNRSQDEITDSMSAKGRESLRSNMFTDPGSIPLKLAQMSPFLVASALPAGIVGAVARSAAAAVGTSAGAGAAMGVNDLLNEVYKQTDSMPAAELAKQSDLFAGMLLRHNGDETAARAEFNDYLQNKDGRLALTALLGGVGGAFGLPAAVGRGAARRALGKEALAGKERALAVAKEMGKEGITEGAEEGYSENTRQEIGLELGKQKEYDLESWRTAVFNGFGMGVLTAGAGEYVATGGRKPKAETPPAPEVDPAAAAALAAANPAPGNPEGNAAPAAPPAVGPKGRAAVAKARRAKKGPEQVGENAPASDQAAALGAKQAENAGGAPAPTVDQIAESVTPPPAPPPAAPPAGWALERGPGGVTDPTFDAAQAPPAAAPPAAPPPPVAETPVNPEVLRKAQGVPTAGAEPLPRRVPAEAPPAAPVPVAATPVDPAVQARADAIAAPPAAPPVAETPPPAAPPVAETPSPAAPPSPVAETPPMPVGPAKVLADGQEKEAARQPVGAVALRARIAKQRAERLARESAPPAPAPAAEPVTPKVTPTGRILESQTEQDTANQLAMSERQAANEATVKQEAKQAEKVARIVTGEPGKGKRRTVAEKQARAENNRVADEVVSTNQFDDADIQTLLTKNMAVEGRAARSAARKRIYDTATAIAKAADERKVTVPKFIKKGANVDEMHAASLHVIRLAKAIAAKKPGDVKAELFQSLGLKNELAKSGDKVMAVEVAKDEAQGRVPDGKVSAKNAKGEEIEASNEPTRSEAVDGARERDALEDSVLDKVDFDREVNDVMYELSGRAKAAGKEMPPGQLRAMAEHLARIRMREREAADAEPVTQRVAPRRTEDEASARRKDIVARWSKRRAERAAKAKAAEEQAKPTVRRIDPKEYAGEQAKAREERITARMEKLRGEMKAAGMDVPDARLRAMAEKEVDKANPIAELVREHRATPRSFSLGRGGRTNKRYTAVHSTSLRDLLSEGIWDDDKSSKGLMSFIRSRLAKAAGSVEVHFVDADTAKQLMGPYTLGQYRRRYYGDKGYIVINTAHDAFADPRQLRQTVMHEGVHAAFENALNTSELATQQVAAIMQDVILEMDRRGDVPAEWYAMTDTSEFVAEAFSNPRFQAYLRDTSLRPDTARKIGLPTATSAWQAFVNVVRRVLGLGSNQTSALEAVMRIASRLEEAKPPTDAEMSRRMANEFYEPITLAEVDASLDPELRRAAYEEGLDVEDLFEQLRGIIDEDGGEELTNDLKVRATNVKDLVEKAADQPGAKSVWEKAKLALSTTADIAQSAKRYFGGNEPIQRIADLMEQRRIEAQRRLKKADVLIGDLYKAMREHTPAQWERFTQLMHDATMASVDPEGANTHLGTKSAGGARGRGREADIKARFNALPDDLKELWRRSAAYYTNAQKEQAAGLVRRIMVAAGHNDEALIDRITNGKITKADDQLLGEPLTKMLKQAKTLKSVGGVYFPLMRQGDYVVVARYDVQTPAGATKLEENKFQFTDETAAFDFAANSVPHVEMVTRWVDSATGKDTFPDGTRVSPNDTNAVKAYVATVDDRHVEFHESAKDAEQARRDLVAAGTFKTVEGVQPRKDNPNLQAPGLLASNIEAFKRSIAARKGYQNMSAQAQKELNDALGELAIRLLPNARVQHSKLPRRYVAGASRDAVRVMHDYAVASSHYIAKLKYADEMDQAFKEAEAYTNDHRSEASERTMKRGLILREMEDRVNATAAADQPGAISAGVNRLMAISFLDKLASPAFSFINALQPAMVTLPVITGRHGLSAIGAITRAYSLIGARSTALAGITDMAKAFKGEAGTNYLARFKDRLPKTEEGKRVGEMLDYLADRGLLDEDAGMEIGRLIKSQEGAWSRVDRGLAYAENISRQLPTAIEAINRAVSSIAAYQLEYAKTGDHAASMRYARDVVVNTQGNYSHTNAAPIFRHPVGRVVLQFKKFGQMMYHLLGQTIGQAVKGASREEKIQAYKTLAMLAVTHTAMAGTLGLPTEPIKVLLLAAQAAGLSGVGWDDVERWQREKATEMLGVTGGELLTRGVSRLAGVDLSSRVGIDSLLLHGQPMGDKQADVKAWILDQLIGAPGGMVVSDIPKGLHALTDGDYGKAAELLIPLKVISDTIKAGRGYSEGKMNARGVETLSPYGPGEAAARALGFTPRREAETQAARGAVAQVSRDRGGKRNELMNKFMSARSSEDRAKAERAIEDWNKTMPAAERITKEQRVRAIARRRQDEQGGRVVAGVRVGRNPEEYRRIEAIYNTR